jgi:hypothetical protein
MSLLNSKILKKLTLGLVGVACYAALAVSNCSACDSSVDETEMLVFTTENEIVSIELTEDEKQSLQEKGELALEGVNVEGVIENNDATNVIATDVYFTDETTEVAND